MKLAKHETLILILMSIALATMANPLAAQVYKIVDQDGNVTFTDQAPGDGSQPIELRPISVIEAPNYQTTTEKSVDGAGTEDVKGMSLRDLRKNYGDFAIVAPQPEESVWNQGQAITVAWNTRYALQQGMQVIVSIDGDKQAATTAQIIPVTGLERGQHTVTATLQDSNERRIASASVTFFVRQPSLYNRQRLTPSPQGGG